MLNDNIHLVEYQIREQFIIPIAYILISVWDLFAQLCTKRFLENPVQFQNLKFINNFKIYPNSKLYIYKYSLNLN